MLRLLKLAFWSSTLFAFVMAVLPHPPELHVWDKLQHMAAFFVITTLGCAAYPRLARVKLLGALVAFGGFIEIVQMIPVLHRDSEWGDWFADTFAIAVALACCAQARKLDGPQAD